MPYKRNPGKRAVNPPRGEPRKDREKQVALEARPPRACGGLSCGEQAEGNTNSPLWRGLGVFHLFSSWRRGRYSHTRQGSDERLGERTGASARKRPECRLNNSVFIPRSP